MAVADALSVSRSTTCTRRASGFLQTALSKLPREQSLPSLASSSGAVLITEIRSCTAKGLTASADIFAKRFEQEMKAGRLTCTPSAKVRGRALVGLLQGLQLRAKVGIAREQLLQDARSYVPLILGKQI
jgi:hypothetical protein